MNTPYQTARLADGYAATDADGQLVLIGRFEAQASDGYKTGYQHRDVTWVVWLRGGRIISAHRYAGSRRVTALREWREIAKMQNVAVLPDADRLAWERMPWKEWAPIARSRTLG